MKADGKTGESYFQKYKNFTVDSYLTKVPFPENTLLKCLEHLSFLLGFFRNFSLRGSGLDLENMLIHELTNE